MRENGEMTLEMEKATILGLMEVLMRVNSKMIWDMAKDHPLLKTKRHMKACGWKVKKMDMVSILGLIHLSIRVTSRKISFMVKERWSMQMAIRSTAIGLMAKKLEKVNTHGLMVSSMKENTKMTGNMGREKWLTQIKATMRVNGKMMRDTVKESKKKMGKRKKECGKTENSKNSYDHFNVSNNKMGDRWNDLRLSRVRSSDNCTFVVGIAIWLSIILYKSLNNICYYSIFYLLHLFYLQTSSKFELIKFRQRNYLWLSSVALLSCPE